MDQHIFFSESTNVKKYLHHLIDSLFLMDTCNFNKFLILVIFSSNLPNVALTQSNRSSSSMLSVYSLDPHPDMPNNPGLCYAKFYVQNEYDTVYQEFAVYNGLEIDEDVDLNRIEVITKPFIRKWNKKTVEESCLSGAPEDLIIWCLVEEPEVKEELLVLQDTTQSSNFTLTRLQIQRLIKKGGYSRWRQIVCKEDLNSDLIAKLQKALFERGYGSGKIDNQMNAETKRNLVQYQKDHGLPVGQLDFETLRSLGIN